MTRVNQPPPSEAIADFFNGIDPLRSFGGDATFSRTEATMSAPDYDDPKSKLNVRLRPVPGSATILKWGSVLGGIGAAFCLVGFVASFIPSIRSDGNPLVFLLGVAVFASGSGAFYLGHKLVHRLR